MIDFQWAVLPVISSSEVVQAFQTYFPVQPAISSSSNLVALALLFLHANVLDANTSVSCRNEKAKELEMELAPVQTSYFEKSKLSFQNTICVLHNPSLANNPHSRFYK